MAEADWDEVTYLKKKPVRSGDAKSQKVLIVFFSRDVKNQLSGPWHDAILMATSSRSPNVAIHA